MIQYKTPIDNLYLSEAESAVEAASAGRVDEM